MRTRMPMPAAKPMLEPVRGSLQPGVPHAAGGGLVGVAEGGAAGEAVRRPMLRSRRGFSAWVVVVVRSSTRRLVAAAVTSASVMVWPRVPMLRRTRAACWVRSRPERSPEGWW